MCWNCLTNQRTAIENSPEHDQKLIMSGEHHKCIHQVWDQFPERFVQKCIEITKVWRKNGWTDERTYEQTGKQTSPFLCPPPTLLAGDNKQLCTTKNLAPSQALWICIDGNSWFAFTNYIDRHRRGTDKVGILDVSVFCDINPYCFPYKINIKSEGIDSS